MIKNIIFDWSGTLADDLVMTYKATMYVFEKLGVKPMSLEEYRNKFFLPYMGFCKNYLPNCTTEQIKQLFLEGVQTVVDVELYPEVKNVLKKLYDRDIKMIIMSATTKERIIADAKRYNILDYFQEIDGDIFDKTKIIVDTIQRNGFNPEETMCVGDMPHDIDAAKKVGAISVGIFWGHKPKEMLGAVNPDYLISNITELEKLLN
ncbi:MAG: HAD family hydrolase [Patescibacteria group bacterium]